MVTDEGVRATSRRLRALVEPIAANVYFAKEAQEAYGELGLGYIPGYFCSRSACMGRVPGEVVVSAFGVFNPDVVVPAIDEGRAKTDIDRVVGDYLASRSEFDAIALVDRDGHVIAQRSSSGVELARVDPATHTPLTAAPGGP